MLFAERIAKKLADFGEQFVLNGVAYKGLYKVADSTTLRSYLDDVEMLGVTHPALLLITRPDVPIVVGDAITRDSRTYTVLKTGIHRIGDTDVVMLAILS